MHAFPDFLTLLKKYEQPGYSDAKLLIVTIPLLIAAMYSDPTLFDRYGEATVAELEKRSGMQVMKRLRRYMPSVLALILGVVYGYLRWLWMKKSERPAQFAYPIAYFAVAAQLNAQSIFRLNRRLNDAIIARLEPMGSLPSTLAVRLVHDGMYAGRHLLSGRFKEGLGYLEGMQTNVHLVRDLDERGRQHFILGNGFWEGRIKLLRFGAAPLTHAEALRASPLPFHWIMGESLRYAYHAGRGEVAAAEQVREVLDTLTARHGGAWVADLLTALEFTPYHIAGDVIGLKRCIEQLEQLVALHPDIALPLEVARAMYQGHRKRADRSLRIYASIASQLEPFSNPLWSQAQAHWAECLNSEGLHDDALKRCQAALLHVGEDKDDFVGAYQQLEREQAIALAGLGEYGEAAALLDDLIRRHGGQDQPLWVGLLHRDRARVAALSGDSATFALHMAEVSARFRATGNPALVAQLRTLAELGAAKGVTAADSSLSEHHITEELSLLRFTEQGALDATGRAQRLLDHVVRIAGARAGRLYSTHTGGARLIAQRGDDEWDAGLDAQVEALMLVSYGGGDTTVMTASATGRRSTNLASTSSRSGVSSCMRATSRNAITAFTLGPSPTTPQPTDTSS